MEWSRLAEPQPDGCDTAKILQLTRGRGYVRPPVNGERTCFDGRVPIRDLVGAFTEDQRRVLKPAPHDHPNIEKACALIRLWPAAFAQCQGLLESLSPFLDTRKTSTASSLSDQFGSFGQIAATVNDSTTLALAIVREMAHLKLHALGVRSSPAERILLNPLAETYLLDPRTGARHPMHRLVHTQYAATYVCALSIQILNGLAGPHPRAVAARALASHLPKLEFRAGLIRDHARLDRAGEGFFEGYFSWLDRLLGEGRAFLVAAEPSACRPESASVAALEMGRVRPSRLAGVHENTFINETLLYVPNKNLALSLNSSARAVWELCDGNTTVIEISRKIGRDVGYSDAELPDSLTGQVAAAVVKFHELGLLEPHEHLAPKIGLSDGQSR